MKRLLKGIGVLLGGIILGTVGMCLVFLLPVEPMQEHMRESLESFMEEGENPFLLEGIKGSSLDNYTDATMLGLAVYQSDKPFYQSAMLALWHTDEAGTMEALEEYLTEGGAEEEDSYARYWQGYLLFLKPLLLFLILGQIRILNGIVAALLTLAILLLLCRRGMQRGAVAYLLAILALFPVTIPFSLQFSTCFYVGSLAVLAVLAGYDRLEQNQSWPYLFLVTGICTSFVDFLTYPVFTFGMPVVLWLVMDRRKWQDSLRQLLQNGLAWCAGYLGMWMGKWTVGSLLTGQNLWSEGLANVLIRTSGEAYDDKVNRIFAILRNFYIYANVWGVLLAIAVLGWLIFWFRKYGRPAGLSRLCLLLAVACIPLVWYLLAANHSYVHYWYTFRNLAVSVFALGMIPELIKERGKCADAVE
ncbi:MAG: hypothetical protein LUC60_08770 [Lachnospiraceae bacterium]|nr:hypothetical protein [Lachnospiraceae bacterium]